MNDTMDVLEYRSYGPDLAIDQGEATIAKATDQSSYWKRYGAAMAKKHLNHSKPIQLPPRANTDKSGFAAEQADLDAVNKRRQLINKLTSKSEIDEVAPREVLVEPRSNDYVKMSAFLPRRWDTGLDGRNAVLDTRSNVCQNSQAKPQPVKATDKKPSTKAQRIAGYLRRKALCFRGTTKPAATNDARSTSAVVEEQPVIKTNNAYTFLKDEVVDGDDQDNAPMEPSGEACEQGGGRPKRLKKVKVKGEPEVDPDDEAQVLIDLPNFRRARALRDKKSRKTFAALTYYLKCKHFMHVRDPHFIRTLVQDARAWLIRSDYKMESYHDYTILASSVASAFFVDQQELGFRARMKNRTEWHAIDKINHVCVGDLGYRHGHLGTRFNLRHAFQSRVFLPNAPTVTA